MKMTVPPTARHQRLLRARRVLRRRRGVLRGARRPAVHGGRDGHRLHARHGLQPRLRSDLDEWRYHGSAAAAAAAAANANANASKSATALGVRPHALFLGPNTGTQENNILYTSSRVEKCSTR
jgi:hypothetical protein